MKNKYVIALRSSCSFAPVLSASRRALLLISSASRVMERGLESSILKRVPDVLLPLERLRRF